MVHKVVSEQRGYATDGGQASENCFAEKPFSKQVKECEKVISKLHSILQSLNIRVTRYKI